MSDRPLQFSCTICARKLPSQLTLEAHYLGYHHQYDYRAELRSLLMSNSQTVSDSDEIIFLYDQIRQSNEEVEVSSSIPDLGSPEDLRLKNDTSLVVDTNIGNVHEETVRISPSAKLAVMEADQTNTEVSEDKARDCRSRSRSRKFGGRGSAGSSGDSSHHQDRRSRSHEKRQRSRSADRDRCSRTRLSGGSRPNEWRRSRSSSREKRVRRSRWYRSRSRSSSAERYRSRSGSRSQSRFTAGRNYWKQDHTYRAYCGPEPSLGHCWSGGN